MTEYDDFKEVITDISAAAPKEPKKHIHSFVRYKYSKKLVTSGPAKGSNVIYYKCNDPLCTTTYDREMLVGKLNLCPSCKVNTFILDRQALKRAVPKCIECRNTKEGKRHKAAVALVKGLFENKEEE